MIGRDSKADLDAYGIWSWIFGLAIAGAIFAAMFMLAQGFA